MVDVDLDRMSIRDLKELVKLAEAKIKEKSARGKEEVLEKFKEIADEYGMTVEAVLGMQQPENNKTYSGAIPTGAITDLMNVAPNGLFNPDAPEEQREWKRSADTGRWVPISSWIKKELAEIRNQNGGEIPKAEIQKLAEKYPPRQ